MCYDFRTAIPLKPRWVLQTSKLCFMPTRFFTSNPALGPIRYNPGSRSFPEKRSEGEERCTLRRIEARGGANVTDFLGKLWSQEEGQDIAEYAVMLAVILVIVVGTLRLIGGSANNVFSATASSIGQ
jgi:Flp pilus assembly pilin Flp